MIGLKSMRKKMDEEIELSYELLGIVSGCGLGIVVPERSFTAENGALMPAAEHHVSFDPEKSRHAFEALRAASA